MSSDRTILILDDVTQGLENLQLREEIKDIFRYGRHNRLLFTIEPQKPMWLCCFCEKAFTQIGEFPPLGNPVCQECWDRICRHK